MPLSTSLVWITRPSDTVALQGSILIQRVGAKVVLTANMLCTSAILFTLPFLTSIYPMFSLLAIMGLLQVNNVFDRLQTSSRSAMLSG